jgi:hypothetical protein
VERVFARATRRLLRDAAFVWVAPLVAAME